MKKILALAIITLTLQISASAQTQRSNSTTKSRSSVQQRSNDLENLDGLNLTEAQKVKIQAIKADGKSKMQAIKAQNLSPEEQKAQMMKLRQEQKTQIQLILTDNQKAILKKHRAEHKDDIAKGHQGKKHAGNAGINDEFKAKFKAIKNDPNLTQEQKKAACQKLKEEYKNSRIQGAASTK